MICNGSLIRFERHMDYAEFLERKTQSSSNAGFTPTFMPSYLFDFQQSITAWAIERGRGALFEDCGLGKTVQELVWAQNIVEHTNRPVLILTPLAVGPQTVAEGVKFGIDCERSRDGKFTKKIVITNYEKLHLFDSDDFAGVVCDESSILKHFTGATQKNVTRFLLKTSYRLLATATPSPNDHTELGTASEALGELGMVDMLGRFFKQETNKSQIARMKSGETRNNANVIAGTGGGWRMKGHAVIPFWKWVASWARACRMPSDLGFDNGAFELPELIEREHIVIPSRPASGLLFVVPALGLKEERDERRRTLKERCDMVARLVDHPRHRPRDYHVEQPGRKRIDAVHGCWQRGLLRRAARAKRHRR